MNNDQPFTTRELTNLFEHIKGELVAIKEQTQVTNGKVKKLILAVAIIFGILIGTGMDVSNLKVFAALLI